MEKIDYKAVGKRLKKLIYNTGMNQTEFANLCEVNEGTLRLHIRGELKKGINCDCLYAYSRALNVSMEYLLTGETKKEQEEKAPTAQDVANALNFLLKTLEHNATIVPIDYDSYYKNITNHKLCNQEIKEFDDKENDNIWIANGEDCSYILGIIFKDEYITKYLDSRLKMSIVSTELKNILGEEKYNKTLEELLNVNELYLENGKLHKVIDSNKNKNI